MLVFTPPRAPPHGQMVLELFVDWGSSKGSIFVSLDTGGGYPPTPNRVVSTEARRRIYRATIPGNALRAARIDVQPGTRLCLRRLSVTEFG
jgi:hypothetical protein